MLSARAKSVLWSVTKYIVALGLLALVLSYVDIGKLMGYIHKIPPYKLVLALLLVSLAQVASAYRMRYFFLALGFPVNPRFAILLFYVGAFYNFLLPGGIGGDAYKVILVRRRMEIPAMQGVRLMIADRASGLCLLMLVMYAALATMDFSPAISYARALIALAAAATVAAYLILSRMIVKLEPRVMLGSLPYSLTVQLLWIASLASIWSSLSDSLHPMGYLSLYCAASITSMLPVSVGGLGIKEGTYFYGAQLLQHLGHENVDPVLGVSLSLCTFALSFVAALPGLFWLSKIERTHHA